MEWIKSRPVFWQNGLIQSVGIPRMIIAGFLVFLFVLAVVLRMDLTFLISDPLVRIGMNGLLVLAMVPTITCGAGLNFALPVGILCGLVGGVVSMSLNLRGWVGFGTAALLGIVLAWILGYVYALLLDKVQGQEMMVGTYVGFSMVAGMCIFWLAAPIKNPAMVFAIGGQGLRYTLTLENYYSKLLNHFLEIKLWGITIPTGLLMFFGLGCALMHFFLKTRVGRAMAAAGSNPLFAKSSGVNLNAMRHLGVVISTVLGAIGILAYAQSYGFLQLYTAPLYMAFPAVASILIGGASLQKASISQVVIGTILFQTLLTIALPVTQTVLSGADVSEIARMIISNGMILYALTRGERRR